MNIALMAVDSRHPNLALMRISAYHKDFGDSVEWYTPFNHYDILYMAKVFTFTSDYALVINNADKVVKGGTGYDIASRLPREIEATPPDYSIYPDIDDKTAYGFLTRGCIRNCPWCIVPKKEGTVRPYRDIDEVCAGGRTNAILMDNNILAAGEYGMGQLHKIAERGYRVDFNQALDARLVDDEKAELLARIKWIKRLRFAADTPAEVEDCDKAIALIRKHGCGKEVFIFTMLHGDVRECYERTRHWRGQHKVLIFAQPFRDPYHSNTPPQWQKDMARWANRKELYKTCDFKDYEPRKCFICKQYFDK